jgi:hypothetical protein
MGKRQRRRSKAGPGPQQHQTASDYTDPDGNVLTLRDSLSPATVRKLTQHEGSAGATAEDVYGRRAEMLFERLTVRWTIAGLPLEGQAELLARFRMADRETLDWVGRTIGEHLERRGIALG